MDWTRITDRLPGGNRRVSKRAVAYLAELEETVIDLTAYEKSPALPPGEGRQDEALTVRR
jgi:hypothetical protein